MKRPHSGYIFWPVGTGDSATIVIGESLSLQVDLHHLGSSEDEDDNRTPVIDELTKILPQRNGRPYLAGFALTHPDQDHCRGFAQLLEEVDIGELWFTPRVFREYKKELCDDAAAFKKEAERRVAKTIATNGSAKSGDRVRVVGYDDILKRDKYKGFPRDRLLIPGNSTSELDGNNCATFRAFIHAPFKADNEGERNDTSLAMQVRLSNDAHFANAMLLGDHEYENVKRIFEKSPPDEVSWNVFLSPHHCSKSVMYVKDDDGNDKLKKDVLELIEGAAAPKGIIVASSDPIPDKNEPGDNPPHAKARSRYMERAPGGFRCTQEFPSEDSPKPMVFEMTGDGLVLHGDKSANQQLNPVKDAVEKARGEASPPPERVGFG